MSGLSPYAPRGSGLSSPVLNNRFGFSTVLHIRRCGKGTANRFREVGLNGRRNRLLRECVIEGEIVGRPARPTTAKRPRRSVTVNLAESPLGWLYAHGHLSRRQFDAGEKLRQDWERGQLSAR